MARRTALPTAALLVACLALSACGGDDGGTAAADSIVTTVASTTTIPATTTTRPKATTTTAAPTTTVVETTTTVAETTTTAIPTTTAAPVAALQPVTPPAPRADEAHVELGSIEIPKLGVSKLLLEGITLTTLDKAPGHWPGTAMPGQLGNAVIAGHRTSHDKPFRNIDKLVPGDEVIMTTADGRFVYVVTGTEVVSPDAMYIIDQTADATATLFACHPPGSTKQRIVVHLALQA